MLVIDQCAVGKPSEWIRYSSRPGGPPKASFSCPHFSIFHFSNPPKRKQCSSSLLAAEASGQRRRPLPAALFGFGGTIDDDFTEKRWCCWCYWQQMRNEWPALGNYTHGNVREAQQKAVDVSAGWEESRYDERADLIKFLFRERGLKQDDADFLQGRLSFDYGWQWRRNMSQEQSLVSQFRK